MPGNSCAPSSVRARGSVIPLFALLLGVLLMLGFFAVSIGIASNSKSQLLYAASQAARTALNEFHSNQGTTAQKAQLAADRASLLFQQNARLLGYLGGERRDPGGIVLSKGEGADRRSDRTDEGSAGTIKLGVWYTAPANCGPNGCEDVCHGSYPCFVESALSAAATTINAVQVTVSLTPNNSFDLVLGKLFGSSPFTTTVSSTAVNQPRCYEVLVDASGSGVRDNYNLDIANVVPSSMHPTWGGSYAAYSFSNSAREFGDFLYTRYVLKGGKSTAYEPGTDAYPEPEDCSEHSLLNPITDPTSDWNTFSQEFQNSYGLPPAPSAAGEMSFIWCAMRTFRETRNDLTSTEHFASDYRPIVPDFGDGPEEVHWVDAYMADSGRGPQPLRTVLLAVHNLVKRAMNSGYGSDYMMIRTFGANLRPAIAGLYGRDDFPYLLQVTNPENGPIVRPDNTEEPAIYPNFATIGALPDEDHPYTNLLLPMYQAIEDLTRDPIAGPPAPGMFACPANAVKRIIIASDFMMNCTDTNDFNVSSTSTNSCPYNGGAGPIYYCFKSIPVGIGATYCSSTFSGWKWLDFWGKISSQTHPGGGNPYTGQPWEWSTRFFSGNPTYLSNALAAGGISVLSIMAGNSVGPNWVNKANPNVGAAEYQWMDWDMWAARQNINPQSPPTLNALSGFGPLGIVNAGAREIYDWRRMESGTTGSPADGVNYRPFTAPNRVAAWLALVSGGSFCPLRTTDSRVGNCSADNKLHPGNNNRFIHCDSVSEGCRSDAGSTNCNSNPERCTEFYDHQCMPPTDRLQECIANFTAQPLALVERVGP